MKRFFTLITTLLISVSLLAQTDDFGKRADYNNKSKLSISTSTNTQVRVQVDGNNYNNRNNENDLVINDIRPGYHRVKVYQQKNDKYGKRFNKNLQLVYDGNIYIKPQYHTDISINRFGKAYIDERQINSAYYAEYNENEYDGYPDNNYSQVMNNRSFEQFRQSLKNENFDNTRLTLAKQTIATNTFSSAQVKDLVHLFSFDNSKLDIAKYSYKYTVDKNNYFLLNDAFAFSSSKEDLTRYIQGYR